MPTWITILLNSQLRPEVLDNLTDKLTLHAAFVHEGTSTDLKMIILLKKYMGFDDLNAFYLYI